MSETEKLLRVEEMSNLLFDGLLSVEEKAEFNDLLRGDPIACEHYLALSEIHASLAYKSMGSERDVEKLELPELVPFNASETGTADAAPVGKTPKGIAKHLWLPLAAAAAIAIASVLWILPRNSLQFVDDGVAIISEVAQPAGQAAGYRLQKGQVLPAGSLTLESGIVQVDFYSGASLVVEGPANLTIENAWKAVLNSGKVRASVPEPAQGFVVDTPEYRATDLGTEFALSVTESEGSELHVIKGEVRLDSLAGESIRSLYDGEGIRWISGKNSYESIEGKPSNFVGLRKIQLLSNSQSKDRLGHWRNVAQTWKSDPDTLIYYDFDDATTWSRHLKNRAKNNDLGSDGAVIGAQWVSGRWSEKKALEMKGMGNRVRFNVKGEHTALTMMMWVRIGETPNNYNTLMLTDGFDQGEPHWQISNKGRLILGLGGARPSVNVTTRDGLINEATLGKWIMMAVVIDQTQKTVKHYLNGKLVEEGVKREMHPIRIGNAQLGNWNSAGNSSQKALRPFNGVIGEFLMLQRTATQDDLTLFYESGKP